MESVLLPILYQFIHLLPSSALNLGVLSSLSKINNESDRQKKNQNDITILSFFFFYRLHNYSLVICKIHTTQLL